MSQIVISHSPVDLDPLLEVHEALRLAGIPDWYPTSTDEVEKTDLMVRKLDTAFAMLVIVSAQSIRAKHVQRDISLAKARGVPIIAYRIDSARLTGIFKSDIAPSLKHQSATPETMAALVGDVRAIYRQRCPVIAVMNLKGGIGKTTITAQVFATLQAKHGSRVLMIDLDPQYNLTQMFLDMETADSRAARDRSVISLFERSSLHLMSATSPASDWSALSVAHFTTPPAGEFALPVFDRDGPDGRFDLITGQFEISKYAFATDARALDTIRTNFLDQIEALRGQYDLIVMDTNPNATFLTRCALEACDRIVAPMHADIYSLRGVRLLNQVIQAQVRPELRPNLSVVFNGVSRQEQSSFEADARNGIYDGQAGFALSDALLATALPRSGHLVVRAPDPDAPMWHQLVIHHGRGGGLRAVRESLDAIANELESKTKATAQADAAIA